MAAAKSSNSPASSIAALLFICSLLFLSVSSVEGSRFVFGGHSLQCNKVLGIKSGDTCFAIAQSLELSTNQFNFLNPNLNCTALFVGQWICISGRLI